MSERECVFCARMSEPTTAIGDGRYCCDDDQRRLAETFGAILGVSGSWDQHGYSIGWDDVLRLVASVRRDPVLRNNTVVFTDTELATSLRAYHHHIVASARLIVAAVQEDASDG